MGFGDISWRKRKVNATRERTRHFMKILFKYQPTVPSVK
jgi:hypothetical protein